MVLKYYIHFKAPFYSTSKYCPSRNSCIHPSSWEVICLCGYDLYIILRLDHYLFFKLEYLYLRGIQYCVAIITLVVWSQCAHRRVHPSKSKCDAVMYQAVCIFLLLSTYLLFFYTCLNSQFQYVSTKT